MKRERASQGELLRYALKYAGWGLRVFPLHTVRERAVEWAVSVVRRI